MKRSDKFLSSFGNIKTINLLKPNDIYICRSSALTSRSYILNIYSTNKHIEYSKHAPESPFLSLQNAVYFIMLTCLVPVLFAFYLQDVLKFKCKIPASKGYADFESVAYSLCQLSYPDFLMWSEGSKPRRIN